MVPPVGSLGQTSGKDWTGLQRGGAGSCALRKIPSWAPRGNEELLLEAMTLVSTARQQGAIEMLLGPADINRDQI